MKVQTKNKAVKKAVKELEEKKKPIFVEKLALGEGEYYVGNLPEADKYQLMSRRMIELSNLLQQTVLLLANVTVCMQELCKKQGIDIDRIIDKQN